ncbi:MAG: hypothetical protein JWR50_861 [Mucilaginibacter sp.]|nr:hypothetical protein [Mucilaginibacter sp.]
MLGEHIDVYRYICAITGSKFVFLLPQKPPLRLRRAGKLAFCSRWSQKEEVGIY